jgi:hypothetical protein
MPLRPSAQRARADSAPRLLDAATRQRPLQAALRGWTARPVPSSRDFLAELAAPTLRPWVNLILNHRVLAARARWRSRVVPEHTPGDVELEGRTCRPDPRGSRVRLHCPYMNLAFARPPGQRMRAPGTSTTFGQDRQPEPTLSSPATLAVAVGR